MESDSAAEIAVSTSISHNSVLSETLRNEPAVEVGVFDPGVHRLVQTTKTRRKRLSTLGVIDSIWLDANSTTGKHYQLACDIRGVDPSFEIRPQSSGEIAGFTEDDPGLVDASVFLAEEQHHPIRDGERSGYLQGKGRTGSPPTRNRPYSPPREPYSRAVGRAFGFRSSSDLLRDAYVPSQQAGSPPVPRKAATLKPTGTTMTAKMALWQTAQSQSHSHSHSRSRSQGGRRQSQDSDANHGRKSTSRREYGGSERVRPQSASPSSRLEALARPKTTPAQHRAHTRPMSACSRAPPSHAPVTTEATPIACVVSSLGPRPHSAFDFRPSSAKPRKALSRHEIYLRERDRIEKHYFAKHTKRLGVAITWQDPAENTSEENIEIPLAVTNPQPRQTMTKRLSATFDDVDPGPSRPAGQRSPVKTLSRDALDRIEYPPVQLWTDESQVRIPSTHSSPHSSPRGPVRVETSFVETITPASGRMSPLMVEVIARQEGEETTGDDVSCEAHGEDDGPVSFDAPGESHGSLSTSKPPHSRSPSPSPTSSPGKRQTSPRQPCPSLHSQGAKRHPSPSHLSQSTTGPASPTTLPHPTSAESGVRESPKRPKTPQTRQPGGQSAQDSSPPLSKTHPPPQVVAQRSLSEILTDGVGIDGSIAPTGRYHRRQWERRQQVLLQRYQEGAWVPPPPPPTHVPSDATDPYSDDLLDDDGYLDTESLDSEVSSPKRRNLAARRGRPAVELVVDDDGDGTSHVRKAGRSPSSRRASPKSPANASVKGKRAMLKMHAARQLARPRSSDVQAGAPTSGGGVNVSATTTPFEEYRTGADEYKKGHYREAADHFIQFLEATYQDSKASHMLDTSINFVRSDRYYWIPSWKDRTDYTEFTYSGEKVKKKQSWERVISRVRRLYGDGRKINLHLQTQLDDKMRTCLRRSRELLRSVFYKFRALPGLAFGIRSGGKNEAQNDFDGFPPLEFAKGSSIDPRDLVDDSAITMSLAQLWRLLKSCAVICPTFSLAEANYCFCKENAVRHPSDPHDPLLEINIYEFVVTLIRIANIRFQDAAKTTPERYTLLIDVIHNNQEKDYVDKAATLLLTSEVQASLRPNRAKLRKLFERFSAQVFEKTTSSAVRKAGERSLTGEKRKKVVIEKFKRAVALAIQLSKETNQATKVNEFQHKASHTTGSVMDLVMGKVNDLGDYNSYGYPSAVFESINKSDTINMNETLEMMEDCELINATLTFKKAAALGDYVMRTDQTFPGPHKRNLHIHLIFEEFLEFVLRAGMVSGSFRYDKDVNRVAWFDHFFKDLLLWARRFLHV
eukprot:Rmarinus@m.29260